MTNDKNKTTRHTDRLTEALLYEHQASDYFREQQKKNRRLAVDICLFFLAGILCLLVADILTMGA